MTYADVPGLLSGTEVALVIADVLAGGLAVLFGTAAVLKLSVPVPADIASVAVRLGVPPALVAGWRGKLLGPLLIAVEIVIAAGLLVPATVQVAAVAAAVFLGGMGALLALALARGDEVRCACFGAAAGEITPRRALLRNGVGALAGVLLASGFGAATGESALGPWAVAVGVVIATLVVALALLAREYRRLLVRDRIGAMAALPTPRFDPGWQLQVADGMHITAGDLLGERSTLMLFTDPGCAPCDRVLGRLGLIDPGADDRAVVIVSRGALEENRQLVGDHASVPIIVQRDFELAQSLGVRGTPGAVVLDSAGFVLSGPALGAEAVIGLIGPMSRPIAHVLQAMA